MSLNTAAVLSYELVDVRGWHCCITSREIMHRTCGCVHRHAALWCLSDPPTSSGLFLKSTHCHTLMKPFNSEPYSYYAKAVRICEWCSRPACLLC